jgi:hypothetical protein
MTLSPTSAEELASREADGCSVTLVWVRETDRARVMVHDRKLGTGFAFDVDPGENPLDVFNHPYAYAACRPGTFVAVPSP